MSRQQIKSSKLPIKSLAPSELAYFEERAAIAEYLGGLTREKAEASAWLQTVVEFRAKKPGEQGQLLAALETRKP